MTAVQIAKAELNPKYAAQWDVLSESNPDKVYKVSQKKEDGTFVCSCPRYIFHKPRTDCKHIIGLKSMETKVQMKKIAVPKSKTMAAVASEVPDFLQVGFLVQTTRRIIIKD